MDPDFDFKVRATGLRIYDLIDEAPHSVFSRDFWINKLFELCLADESFRAKVFRFIDVFPCLNTSASILRHFQEYLGTYLDRPGVNIPPVLKRIMRSVPPDSRAAAIFARPVAMAIRNIAGQFMVGSDA
jgi:RHH-type proline utilization regulon transcriptional repressor/proline dehydrogenase/delta 1-pyrroline-5-carboxylate dehydrogenase